MVIFEDKSRGFTLIELMIVVAIIGVLAAIAYPSYQRYVINTKRTDAMTELQNIASRIEAQKLVQGRYTDIPLANVLPSAAAGVAPFPSTNPLYDVSIWNVSTDTPAQMTATNLTHAKWEIRAVPKTTGMMKNDGTLTLNNVGLKCRNTTPAKCGMNNEWQ